MAASKLLRDARAKEHTKTAAAVPSGFILKLYQMCNGAPDDVISWTANGDAFKIGSDLNKLETETLPQYFRHNRFQSLVRQLNFYNFRKVNRERTFWIYKHNLFHRDRPEDLHLLRRRTCPGVDGRKNRFVAVGSRKETEEPVVSRQSSRTASSDESSDTSGDEASQRKSSRRRQTKKRRSTTTSSRVESKRPRRVVSEESLIDTEEKDATEGVSAVQQADEGKECAPETAKRTEMLEQSLVVSQVAMKLEEYVRKAKRGYSLSRDARTRGGVVTPPTGSAFGYLSAHTGGLLTYDDETFDDEHVASEDGKPSPLRRRVSRDSIDVKNGYDSLTIKQDLSSSSATVVSQSNTPVKPGRDAAMFESPPVGDLEIVKEVVGKILASASGTNSVRAPVFAAVIGFCMSTAPSASDELLSKVFHLISSSDTLACEFQEYRAALHPLQRSSNLLPAFMFAAAARENWERDASKIDAVREFKTFAVNYFHKVLLQDSSIVSFTDSEVAALRYTADAWLKSACASS